MSDYHQPVMAHEAVELLTHNGCRGGIFVDATLGGGGHSEALLRCPVRSGGTAVVGLDQDPGAIAEASARLMEFGTRFRAIRANFRDMGRLLDGMTVEGVLMDLGVSSRQLEDAARGFSFQRDGPLDMRMDPEGVLTADGLLNERSEQELSRIFWELGEDWSARRLARAVMERRKQAPLRRTMELVDLVARVMGRRRGRSRIHPATRIFQALRMAVNDELTVLSEGLDGAWARLAPGGRLVVISFHSLEDRVVKIRFRRWAMEEKTGKLLNRKPMRPGDEEVRNNPRARSAKLRAIEKCARENIPVRGTTDF